MNKRRTEQPAHQLCNEHAEEELLYQQEQCL